MGKVPVNMRVEAELWAAVGAEAERRSVTRTRLVVTLLEAAVGVRAGEAKGGADDQAGPALVSEQDARPAPAPERPPLRARDWRRAEAARLAAGRQVLSSAEAKAGVKPR